MKKQPLDTYERMPEGMKDYLSEYGWHFSKAMAHWAIRQMDGFEEKSRELKSKQELYTLLEQNGVKLPDDIGYDALYVYYMLASDLHLNDGSSDLIRYTGYWINDVDGYDGRILRRFYADTIGKGIPIIWVDML